MLVGEFPENQHQEKSKRGSGSNPVLYKTVPHGLSKRSTKLVYREARKRELQLSPIREASEKFISLKFLNGTYCI